jgi:hypothetical protein
MVFALPEKIPLQRLRTAAMQSKISIDIEKVRKTSIQAFNHLLKDYDANLSDSGMPDLSRIENREDFIKLGTLSCNTSKVHTLLNAILKGAFWDEGERYGYKSKLEMLEHAIGTANAERQHGHYRNCAVVYKKWKDHGIDWSHPTLQYHIDNDPNKPREPRKVKCKDLINNPKNFNYIEDKIYANPVVPHEERIVAHVDNRLGIKCWLPNSKDELVECYLPFEQGVAKLSEIRTQQRIYKRKAITERITDEEDDLIFDETH